MKRMDRDEASLRALTILLRSSSSVSSMLKKDMQSYGLNPTEFTVMEVLYSKGAQPIQVIGNKVLLASSSITYVIDQLQKKKYVERKVNEKDRRITLVSLTKLGNDFMVDVFPQHSQLIQNLFSDLSQEDIESLSESLKVIGFKATESLANTEE